MNACYTLPTLDNVLDPSPKQIIQALGRLQAQTPNHTLGNFYIYDLVAKRAVGASDSVAAMLGHTTDEILSMGLLKLAHQVHPDERILVIQHYKRFSTLKPGEIIAINYRMRKCDGSWCWLRTQETPLVVDRDGLPQKILGMMQNISRRRRTLIQPPCPTAGAG